MPNMPKGRIPPPGEGPLPEQPSVSPEQARESDVKLLIENSGLTEDSILDFRRLVRGIKGKEQYISFHYVNVSDEATRERIVQLLKNIFPDLTVFEGIRLEEYQRFMHDARNRAEQGEMLRGVIHKAADRWEPEIGPAFNLSVDSMGSAFAGPVIVVMLEDNYVYVRDGMPDSLQRGVSYMFSLKQ